MSKSVQIGVILISTSFLLGAFYVNWLVDHDTLWRTEILESSIRSSLTYYSHIVNSPPFFLITLGFIAACGILAATLRVLTGGSSGLLFGGSSLLLLCSALSVYLANVTTILEYLKLSPDSPLDIHLTEALQSLAASHIIIAVSLTGVLSLQGAARYSDRK